MRVQVFRGEWGAVNPRLQRCAHMLGLNRDLVVRRVQDFWATVGTFITALFGSGGFRTIIDFITRKLFAMISGDPPR